MKKIKLNSFNIKSLYFIFLFIFIFIIYDAHTGTYILLKYNYEQRMQKNAGFCDKHGYGFIKFVDKKYKKIIKDNIPVLSFADLPDAAGYFYDTKKNISKKYLILLSIPEEKFSKEYIHNYKIIEKNSDCYLLKKND